MRLPERFALYGFLLVVPIIALLGIATEYGLQALLAARGYHYCTYHVISTDKGGNGTYVYTRNDRPDLCAAAKLIFPPRTKVPGQRAPFDLPFAREDWAGCVRILEPVAADVVRVGGSGAQRELLDDMLLLAAMRSGEAAKASAMLDRRLHRRPSPRDKAWHAQILL